MTAQVAAGHATVRQPSRFDVSAVRADFPALRQSVHGKPLVYLDSAASALKPRSVIDTLSEFYGKDSANVHRGVHLLSQRATLAFESARSKVRAFVNAREDREIVFVRRNDGGNQSVAATLGRVRLRPGDECRSRSSSTIPTSFHELACEATGAKLVVARGRIPRRSGGLGRRKALRKDAHRLGGAPIEHPRRSSCQRDCPAGARTRRGRRGRRRPGRAPSPVDVQDLDVGLLRALRSQAVRPDRRRCVVRPARNLETLPPARRRVHDRERHAFEKTTSQRLADRYEAGTPPIADAIGLGAAIDYLTALDRPALEAHERDVLDYGTRALEAVPGLRLIGTAPSKIGVLSFVVDGIHPHDLGTLVDAEGVAIRTGHHCTQPLMARFGIPATARFVAELFHARRHRSPAAIHKDQGALSLMDRASCTRTHSRPGRHPRNFPSPGDRTGPPKGKTAGGDHVIVKAKGRKRRHHEIGFQGSPPSRQGCLR